LWTSRQGLKELANPVKHGLGFKISRDGEHCIIRKIVIPVMVVKVLTLHRIQVSKITDDFVMVGMDPECSGLYLLAQPEKGLIFTTLTLRDNYGPFRADLVFFKQAIEHSVCFQAHGKVNLIRR
jgi:hypothetical protein